MDGTLAAIFFIAGLTDMTINHCPTGCLSSAEDEGGFILQASKVEFDRTFIGEEFGVGYEFRRTYGPFQPVAMATLTDKDRLWVGLGARWERHITQASPIFVEASFLPGLETGGHGPDIGGHLQFRSSLGLGYTFDNGATLSVSYDHRSNGDTKALNPGLETLSLRITIPFN